MSNAIKITIPQPCHENWASMTPTEKGRHCAVCTKEVIDFTSKTDKELIKLVQSNDNICGRMRSDQVGREITVLAQGHRNKSIPSYLATLLLPLALGMSQNLVAQNDTNHILQTTQTAHHQAIKGATVIQGKIAPQLKMVIKGVVLDDHGYPLPGASIDVKNTYRGVQTDFDGNYNIQVATGETLIFSYVGYKDVEVKVTSQETLRVHLEADALMGEVAIIAGRMIIEATPKKKKRRTKQ